MYVDLHAYAEFKPTIGFQVPLLNIIVQIIPSCSISFFLLLPKTAKKIGSGIENFRTFALEGAELLMT